MRYVALYSRVSTTQHQKTGLEAQVRSLETYAGSHGISDFKHFTDEASGRKSSRIGLDEMMLAVVRGEASEIVVYSLSRFSRSTKHLLESLDTLKMHSTNFVSLTESLDTKTPTGIAVLSIISAINALEADLIRERVVNGLANARAKGVKLGAPKKHSDKIPVIHHLADQNLSHEKIAGLVGVSQSTVSRELRKRHSKMGA